MVSDEETWTLFQNRQRWDQCAYWTKPEHMYIYVCVQKKKKNQPQFTCKKKKKGSDLASWIFCSGWAIREDTHHRKEEHQTCWQQRKWSDDQRCTTAASTGTMDECLVACLFSTKCQIQESRLPKQCLPTAILYFTSHSLCLLAFSLQNPVNSNLLVGTLFSLILYYCENM